MKKIIGNVSVLIFGVILTVVVIDLAVWLSPRGLLPPPLRQLVGSMDSRPHNYMRADSTLRYVMKPGAAVDFVGKEFSFRIQTHLNFPNAGFRGGVLGGQVWGVAVGDSFTFGCCVNQEDTWVALLAGFAKREIANLGIPGYAPPQYTRTLEKYGAPLKPKVVLYGLYSNDLIESVLFDQWLLKGKTRQRFSFKRFVKHYSVVYNLVDNMRGPRRKDTQFVTIPGLEVKLDRNKLQSPFKLAPEGFDSAWALVDREIDNAIELSKRIDAAFVLLYFPAKEEVYWDLIGDKKHEFRLFEKQKNKVSEAALELCRSRRLACLDLTPALKAEALQPQDLYYPVDIHWNEKGYQIAAKEIYRFLSSEKLL
jgi:hypothetical protein